LARLSKFTEMLAVATVSWVTKLAL